MLPAAMKFVKLKNCLQSRPANFLHKKNPINRFFSECLKHWSYLFFRQAKKVLEDQVLKYVFNSFQCQEVLTIRQCNFDYIRLANDNIQI